MPNRARWAVEGVHVAIYCLGCKEEHVVRVLEPHAWGWNGSFELPTFTPSLLVRGGHFSPSHKEGDPCWCTMKDAPFACVRCHSFITNGSIQYLSDCSHELAGKTIELPEIKSE